MENILISSKLETIERENLTFKIMKDLVKKNIDVFSYNLINDKELNENMNYTNIFNDDKFLAVLKNIKNHSDRNKKVIVINDLAVSYLMNNNYSDIIGSLEYLIKNRNKYNLSFIYSFYDFKNNTLFEDFIKEFNKLYIYQNNNYEDIKDLGILESEFNIIKDLKKDEYYIKLY
jgi:hypothetical protein